MTEKDDESIHAVDYFSHEIGRGVACEYKYDDGKLCPNLATKSFTTEEPVTTFVAGVKVPALCTEHEPEKYTEGTTTI